ncbi:MAG: nucleoside hydrolase-like domain-containing protein, partial [Prevotella sp.]
MRTNLIILLLTFIQSSSLPLFSQNPVPERPRILISSDIGGTDPDDNQSMMHYLLYCNEF